MSHKIKVKMPRVSTCKECFLYDVRSAWRSYDGEGVVKIVDVCKRFWKDIECNDEPMWPCENYLTKEERLKIENEKLKKELSLTSGRKTKSKKEVELFDITVEIPDDGDCSMCPFYTYSKKSPDGNEKKNWCLRFKVFVEEFLPYKKCENKETEENRLIRENEELRRKIELKKKTSRTA